MQNEGHDWAEWFNRQGIAYFVLTYRMPNGDREIPMSDARMAIRTVRDSAEVWGINPRDVGIMGFSAGGHLASTVSTHSELAERPDFSILFYPVISMNERETHKGSCVGFLGKEGMSDKQLVREYSNQNAVRRRMALPTTRPCAQQEMSAPCTSIPLVATVSASAATLSTTSRCSTTSLLGSLLTVRRSPVPSRWLA